MIKRMGEGEITRQWERKEDSKTEGLKDKEGGNNRAVEEKGR